MRFPFKASTIGAAFAVVAVAAAVSAGAQDRHAGRGDMAETMKQRFAAADKNGDGKLTKDEAGAGMPFVFKHFEEIDKAHTGAVTLADIAAFAKARRAARQP